jgi:hypothetical protein
MNNFDVDASNVWSPKSGRRGWDDLRDYAKEGWELVSVTSIQRDGFTVQLLYTFKRPIKEV